MGKTGFLDILDIVGQYVQLTPVSDSHYSAKCPFCSSEEESLILSLENQCWSCLSCDADGDRYDFVARSENIRRAEAILMVGHHANSGKPFPHARFKPGSSNISVGEAGRSGEAEANTPMHSSSNSPQSAEAKGAKGSPSIAQGVVVKEILPPFHEFKNIISSYRGGAILDAKCGMIVCDSAYPASADLAEIGKVLAPILEHAKSIFAKWGMSSALPATLYLSSSGLAILLHKSSSADSFKLSVIQLTNPSDLPVARRLVASASTKLT